MRVSVRAQSLDVSPTATDNAAASLPGSRV